MPKIRAVVFDLYGTLIDIETNESKPEIYDFLSKFLKYYGFDMLPDEMRMRIFNETERIKGASKEKYPEVDLLKVFSRALFRDEILNYPFVECIVRIFRILSIERIRLFPEVMDVLKELKKSGYRMAVLSDAQRAFAYSEMRMLGLDMFFDYVFFSTEFGFKKPDPRIFRMVADVLDVACSEIIYVGDSVKRDLIGAKEAGMLFALVRSSCDDFKVKPDVCVKDLRELLSFLEDG